MTETAGRDNGEYWLTPDEIAQFQRDGYVILRGHASAECVSALRTEALSQLAAGTGPAEYEADLHYPGAPDSRAAPGGNTARRLLQA